MISLLLYWTGPAAGARPEVGGGVGALLPTQVLDGPAVQLQLSGRLGFLEGRLWVIGEAGLTRTALTALTAPVAVPGGTALVRADVQQWSVPLLLGLGWRWVDAEGGGVELAVLGGGLLGRTRVLSGGQGSTRPAVQGDLTVDPFLRGRLEWTVPVRPGLVGLGVGWQQHPRLGPPPDVDLRATGPFVEATWRVQF